MKGFLISRCLSNRPECRVSSAAIRSADFSTSTARSVISPKLPIGVATTKSIAHHRFKIGRWLSNQTSVLLFNKADVRTENESVTEDKMRTSSYLLILSIFALVGCGEEPTAVTTTTTQVTTTGPAREVVVTRAPPPVRVETQTVAPAPGYTWTGGYCRWTGTTYVWVPGTWMVHPRPAAVWVEGHWVPRYNGWVWVPGHWQ